MDLFSTDKDLIEKYHIEAPASVYQCAIRTLQDLSDANVSLYSMLDDGEIVGYIGEECLENSVKGLSGFFIVPVKRTKSFIIKFWDAVKRIMGDIVLCGLYVKNTRAISFIEKVCSDIFKHNDKVIFKIDLSCR